MSASKRHKLSHLGDVEIHIPQDTAGGARTVRIKRAVRWLWSRGVYPGPAAMGLRLHGRVRRDLNGVETKVRNEMLLIMNISRQRAASWLPAAQGEGGSDG